MSKTYLFISSHQPEESLRFKQSLEEAGISIDKIVDVVSSRDIPPPSYIPSISIFNDDDVEVAHIEAREEVDFIQVKSLVDNPPLPPPLPRTREAALKDRWSKLSTLDEKINFIAKILNLE